MGCALKGLKVDVAGTMCPPHESSVVTKINWPCLDLHPSLGYVPHTGEGRTGGPRDGFSRLLENERRDTGDAVRD